MRSSCSSGRHERVVNRKRKRNEAVAVSALLEMNTSVDEPHVGDDDPVRETLHTTTDNHSASGNSNTDNHSASGNSNTMSNDTGALDQEVQTEMTCRTISDLELDNRARVIESSCLKSCTIYDREMYVGAPDKVSFYTGLPNVDVLDVIFDLVHMHLTANGKLSKYQQMLLCLIRLRMNYLFKDLAYQLNISVATVQRSFHSVLDVLYQRLSFLIRWPERDGLRKTMPMCFRALYQDKVAVIIDCFELFTEKPSGALNQVQTYSKYKHHQTVKYLIGISPQGTVTFISDGWGGRTSDKHIVEKSGLLNHLVPGDIIMADRGFNIADDVAFYHAKLVIPDFTKGRKQLHPLEVENTRKIASVRIHVERVIGLVVRKFRVFDGEIPLEFLKLKQGETTPTVDKIVTVCCALSSMCPPIVPFE